MCGDANNLYKKNDTDGKRENQAEKERTKQDTARKKTHIEARRGLIEREENK